MAKYKDYGLEGVSSPLQIGKGGGTIVWTGTEFELRTPGGGQATVHVSNPVNPDDVANKNYVDSQVQGISAKDPVMAATTTNINLASPTSNIDGYTVTNGDRILVKDQTDPKENGIYVWASGGATRATDADNINPTTELRPGTLVLVIKGVTHAGDGFAITQPSTGSITLGLDSIVWTKISQQKSFVATDGLIMVGNELRVGTDGVTTEISGDAVAVKSSSTPGQLLISGGSGATPTWGALDLNDTNSVTDTLPTEHGGTGLDASGWDEGRIIISDGNGGFNALDKGADNTVLKVENGTIVYDKIVLSTDTEGTLSVQQGGTGYTTYANGDLLYGDSGSLSKLPIGTQNQIMRVSPAGQVDWNDLDLGWSTIRGTLVSERGGTGYSSYLDNDLLIGNASTGLDKLGVGVSGQVLVVGPAGNIIWGGIDFSDPNSSTGTLPTDRGGTGRTAYNQGDLLIGDATSGLSILPVTANSGRFLQSTGTYLTYSKVDLADTQQVEGTLASDLGGTGFNNYGYGEILYGSGITGDLTKLGMGPASRVLGTGDGATFGWQQIDITDSNLVIGTLEYQRGGTGFSTYSQGDLLTADLSGNLVKLTIGLAGKVLKSTGQQLEYGDVDLANTTGTLDVTRGGTGINTITDGQLLKGTGQDQIGLLGPSDQDLYSETIAAVNGKFERVRTYELQDVKSRIQATIGANGQFIGTVPAYSRITSIKVDVYNAYTPATPGDPVNLTLGDYNTNSAYTPRLVSGDDINALDISMWHFEINHLYTTTTDIYCIFPGAGNNQGNADVIIEYVREKQGTMTNHF